ncbi:hypothetical protein PORY_001957 [Pneumocystis oryctolagi]|uniref:Uncharacterized protein n=1 Tax=Pneumocystis oryctolagi TaxID=42067 RepID=A0ACB7CHA9_9ASCO|nr:hypothetical protein PORY_001957 [Pneumocystis oryctolagi]
MSHQPLNFKAKSFTSLSYKPSGKGKAKIAMKYREDKRQRQITASKRLPGLMKKAAQYSELTGAKVVVLVQDEQRRVYRYCSDGEINIEKSANRMLTNPAEKIFTTEQFSESHNAPNENSEKSQTAKLPVNSSDSPSEKKILEIKKNTEKSTENENYTDNELKENHVNVSKSNDHDANENIFQKITKPMKSSTYCTPQSSGVKMIGSGFPFFCNIPGVLNCTNVFDTSENLHNYLNFENEENNFINSDTLWYPERLKMFYFSQQYNLYKHSLQQLAQKIGDLEIESNEHTFVKYFLQYILTRLRLVIETLMNHPSERKCFRMIGGILVEKSVKEVLPSLKTNQEGIKSTIEQLLKQYKSQEEQFNKWQKDNNVRIIQ